MMLKSLDTIRRLDLVIGDIKRTKGNCRTLLDARYIRAIEAQVDEAIRTATKWFIEYHDIRKGMFQGRRYNIKAYPKYAHTKNYYKVFKKRDARDLYLKRKAITRMMESKDNDGRRLDVKR